MKFNQTALRVALTAAVGAVAMSAQTSAYALGNGDVFTITSGVQAVDSNGNPSDVTSGSFFGMDFNGNSNISGTEKTPVPTGPGFTLGQAGNTVPTAGTDYGTGSAGGTGPVDGTWAFNSNWGTDWFNGTGPSALSGNTLDFSGWTVAWNTLSNIPMTGGAFTVGNCGPLGCGAGATFADGVAFLTITGANYQIDYSATVPTGDPSGFGGTQYFLRLVGTCTAAGGGNCDNSFTPAVPVPAAVWLFGSGL
jgi:hypothetical protein